MQRVLSLPKHLADQPGFQRFLEILPGTASWLFLLSPIFLSILQPLWMAYFVIAFNLFWLVKSTRLSFYLLRGYGKLHQQDRLNWRKRMNAITRLDKSVEEVGGELLGFIKNHPGALRKIQLTRQGRQDRRTYLNLRAWHDELVRLQQFQSAIINPRELYHAVIVATYNESLEVLESSIQGLSEADYNLKHIMLLIAYEERGGEEIEQNVMYLTQKYGDRFGYAKAIKHPQNLPGEIPGKGANITYAGRELVKYVAKEGIDPEKVIVTTLDSDHRPSRNYFAYLSYAYATDPNRLHRSYQPIPMFFNNIWDAPAPMRVIAIGNSFWVLMEAMRPHRLRNFAAHAQGLRTLLDTDFWSVTTIVEDGHQYWRTYFTYDGDHQAVPIYTPVFQDAVLARGYLRTFKVQYLQLRRWAWGVSDLAYVVINSIKNPRIPWSNKLVQIGRLFEGHFSWATASLILSGAAWLPLALNNLLNSSASNELLVYQLPVMASRIMQVTTLALFVTILLSLISLPPRPKHYGWVKSLGMVAQWVLLPFTATIFGSLAAIDAQTRLILGKYLDFRVTEKARRK